ERREFTANRTPTLAASSHRAAWAGLEAAGRQSAMPTIRALPVHLEGELESVVHAEGRAEFLQGAVGHRHERAERTAQLQRLGGGLQHFEAVKGLQQRAADDERAFVLDQ